MPGLLWFCMGTLAGMYLPKYVALLMTWEERKRFQRHRRLNDLLREPYDQG